MVENKIASKVRIALDATSHGDTERYPYMYVQILYFRIPRAARYVGELGIPDQPWGRIPRIPRIRWLRLDADGTYACGTSKPTRDGIGGACGVRLRC